MEEDIKIVENVLKTKEYGLCEITDTFYKAIENLLSALHKANKEKHNQKSLRRSDKRKLRKALSDYRQLLKKCKELEKQQEILTHNYQVAINETINKYVIKETIDKYKEIADEDNMDAYIKIQALQELLERNK